MQQASALREISDAREKELSELRLFATLEAEVRQCPSSSSKESGRVEVACQSDEEPLETEQGTQTNTATAEAASGAEAPGDVEGGSDKENKREMARLRAELAASKGGYELLKLTALQEYATKSGTNRRQLMEAASRVVSLVDAADL